MTVGQRVDKVTIMIERNVEFQGPEGRLPVIFTYVPADPYDDSFVHSLFALIQQKNVELVTAEPPPDPLAFA